MMPPCGDAEPPVNVVVQPTLPAVRSLQPVRWRRDRARVKAGGRL